jgi:myosin-light-chain kinase
VYRCKEKSTGRVFAAKYVTTPKKSDRQDVEREVNIMRKLQHPRLLQLYEAFDDPVKKEMVLVLEL